MHLRRSSYPALGRKPRPPDPELRHFHSMGYKLDGADFVSGRYAILRPIGTGGIGEVYEAFDAATISHVALKIADGASADWADCNRLLEREASALSRIRHENVVGYLGGGLEDGRRFLVMDLLRGMDLHRALVGGGHMSFEEARPIGLQLCDALGAVHGKGMVHADLNPNNIIILEREARPVVIDFNLVRFIDDPDGDLDRNPSGITMGTRAYMAPEQYLAGHCSSFDQRVDVYGLGLVLYEMLTGESAFDRASLDRSGERFRHIMTVPPNRTPFFGKDVPKAAKDTIMKALSKDPTERFCSMEEMADAIDSI
ncbi:MAG: serine/threonine-protein kinase [Candidatus Micrarchaeota archaeon]